MEAPHVGSGCGAALGTRLSTDALSKSRLKINPRQRGRKQHFGTTSAKWLTGCERAPLAAGQPRYIARISGPPFLIYRKTPLPDARRVQKARVISSPRRGPAHSAERLVHFPFCAGFLHLLAPGDDRRLSLPGAFSLRANHKRIAARRELPKK